MKHELAHILIQRLFSGQDLEHAEISRLRRHVSECPGCASLYSRYAQLEDVLCGSPEQGTSFARERVLACVMDRAFHLEEENVSRKKSTRMFATGAGLLAVACALLLLFDSKLFLESGERTSIPAGSRLVEIGLAAKGSDITSNSTRVGVRVFRIKPEGSVSEAGKSLDLSDVVTFTYTNTSEDLGYLALFGVQGGLEFRWYYPGYYEDRSIKILGGVVDEPLGDGIRLAVNHDPGGLVIVAVFSSKPLSKKELKEAVRAKDKQKASLEDMCPLDLEGTVSQCIWADISKGSRPSGIEQDRD